MSISPRLMRAFQALSTVELDEKSRFGALGEFHMQQVLDEEQLLYVFNPIVPIPGKPGRFNESDFLICAYGGLFCVEIKNWRGRVYYRAKPAHLGGHLPLAGRHHLRKLSKKTSWLP